MRKGVSRIIALAGVAAALTAAVPAFAQDDAALDALIDSSGTPAEALALARKQASENDLLGAAATLERALMTHSKNDAEVRLYYATVLCTLGDRQTAINEIARAGHVDANGAAWAETRAACGDVSPPSSGGTRVSGEVSAGIAYDSDLSRSLLIEYALPGYPMVASKDGFSFTASARANFRTAPSGGLYFYGGLGAATKNPFNAISPDFQSGDASLGFGTQSGPFEFLFGGVARHARIDGHPFVTELGGEVEIAVSDGATGRFALHGELVNQDFMGSTVAFSRDGKRYEFGANYSGRSGATRWWVGGAYEHKDAETARTGYAGGRIGASLRQGFGANGLYGSLGTSLRYVEYNDQPGFSPVAEMRFFSRAALGIPLGVEGLGVEAATSYSSRSYNATSTLRNYDNVGAELRLVWTFGN